MRILLAPRTCLNVCLSALNFKSSFRIFIKLYIEQLSSSLLICFNFGERRRITTGSFTEAEIYFYVHFERRSVIFIEVEIVSNKPFIQIETHILCPSLCLNICRGFGESQTRQSKVPLLTLQTSLMLPKKLKICSLQLLNLHMSDVITTTVGSLINKLCTT